MRIVTTTPTGHVGAHVVRALLSAGVRPTVLLRDAARLEPDVRSLVDAVELDQTDTDAVLAATEGADALFWVAPDTGADDTTAAYAALGEVAADVVRVNRIPHTVFQSSGGAEARGGFGEIDGLGAAEDALDAAAREAGVAVTHLRCGYFFTNLALTSDVIATGVLGNPMPTDTALPWVDPRDIAEVAVGRLLSRPSPGTRLQAVHGPADLTFDQVAGLLTAAMGREVSAVEIADDDFRATLAEAGLSEAKIEGLLGMSIGSRDPAFELEQPRDVTSTTPSTLDGWIRSEFLPLVG